MLQRNEEPIRLLRECIFPALLEIRFTTESTEQSETITITVNNFILLPLMISCDYIDTETKITL